LRHLLPYGVCPLGGTREIPVVARRGAREQAMVRLRHSISERERNVRLLDDDACSGCLNCQGRGTLPLWSPALTGERSISAAINLPVMRFPLVGPHGGGVRLD
jgi:hypothetical protein